MNNRKSLIAAIVTSAFVFVIFGSITLQTTPKQPAPASPKYQLVAAKTDIQKGMKINEDDVEIKDFPINIEGGYKAIGEVVGRDAKTDITAGKPIMKSFIKEFTAKEGASTGQEPKNSFRAVPLLVKKSALPPYISTDALFDLFTKENSMRIENLRILSILDPTKDESNKMLVLEIKDFDVANFIKHQVETKGFVFIQKNKDEYGQYKFYDLTVPKSKAGCKIKTGEVTPAKLPPLESIPGIEDMDMQPVKKAGKQIEVIVGSTKSRVEFE